MPDFKLSPSAKEAIKAAIPEGSHEHRFKDMAKEVIQATLTGIPLVRAYEALTKKTPEAHRGNHQALKDAIAAAPPAEMAVGPSPTQAPLHTQSNISLKSSQDALQKILNETPNPVAPKQNPQKRPTVSPAPNH